MFLLEIVRNTHNNMGIVDTFVAVEFVGCTLPVQIQSFLISYGLCLTTLFEEIPQQIYIYIYIVYDVKEVKGG